MQVFYQRSKIANSHERTYIHTKQAIKHNWDEEPWKSSIGDSRGMTRDEDKIKNYELAALLDKPQETLCDALGNEVILYQKV